MTYDAKGPLLNSFPSSNSFLIEREFNASRSAFRNQKQERGRHENKGKIHEAKSPWISGMEMQLLPEKIDMQV